MFGLGEAQIIVKVAGHEGSVLLMGKQLPAGGKWVYWLESDKSPNIGVSNPLPGAENQVDSWQAALVLLDTVPWPAMYPISVHPQFRIPLWRALFHRKASHEDLKDWRKICYPKSFNEHGEFRPGQGCGLRDWLQESKYTVVLTGAGMSTESGVPDFRSESGWWHHMDPSKVATAQALTEHYSLFREFYQMRMQALEGLAPNQGHLVLAQWEQQGFVHAIATQNVDGFHQMAGSKTVFELHGSIRSCRCQNCGESADNNRFLRNFACQSCNGALRPNVVLFDEMLPEPAWHQAVTAIAKAELVLVIGTSLHVYPANQLPSMTRGKTVVINLEPTQFDEDFDVVIHGKAGEVLGFAAANHGESNPHLFQVDIGDPDRDNLTD